MTDFFTCTLGQAAEYGTPDNLTINDLLQRNAKEYSDLPAVGFYAPGADQSTPWNHQLVTFAEVLRGTSATAEKILNIFKLSGRQTVALLCPSTAEFLFTWLGLIRLGHAVLLIAPQCSPSAIVELCKKSDVSHVFYDLTYKDLANSAAGEATNGDSRLDIHQLPFADGSHPFDLMQSTVKPELVANTDENDVAYLHHTSGTSSNSPKPIPQTNHAGVGSYAHFDGSSRATFTPTPLFHGGIADLFRAWTSNSLIWLFPAGDMPITASNINKCLDIASEAKAPPIKYFSSVPYVLEMMAADEKSLNHLRQMDIVAVGGAALPQEVGNNLVQDGVHLASRYGSAECGFLMSSDRDYEKDQAWDYLRADRGAQWFRFEERDGGLSELVVLKGWPHMSKTNRDDGSFATGDLFKPHRSIAHAWRYDSRADAQLTLITGKKFDPAPLEDAISAGSPLLKDALIFGAGKPYPGALLFRSYEARDKPNDDFVNEVWAGVEKLNQDGQSHTRIPRTMLIPMAYAEEPLEKSSKGTVLRKKADERYASEIEGAYEGISSDGQNIPDADLVQYILELVSSVTNSKKSAKLQPDTDLFAFGVDSAACVQIRHAVSKLLPEDSAALPMTVVQDCGSVEKISQMTIDLRHGREAAASGTESQLGVMKEFVEKYSRLDIESGKADNSLPTPPRSPDGHGKTVLLTGPTGALGSHLLAQLLQASEVGHIHLLVRGATQKAANERIRKALTSKQIHIPSDFDDKVSIHLYALSEPSLGLSAESYSRLVQDVDVIYHLAWAVDFTLPVTGFKQHFAGLQALLTLSLQHAKNSSDGKPSQLVFCSSTASVTSYQIIHPGSKIPERIVEDPDCSGDIGYSRSKWVAENICSTAIKSHPELENAISIVRVGQLSGDTVNGIWNKSEAYPLMLSSAKVTGCLPDLPGESVGWVPVDLAARAFLELLVDTSRTEATTSDADKVRAFHLLSQDRTTTWSMLLDWLKKEGKFDVVPPSEWLAKLDELSKSKKKEESEHPSLKLLDFWKTAYGGAGEEKGADKDEAENDGAPYEVKASLESMPTLQKLKPVNEDYALKMWKWIQENV